MDRAALPDRELQYPKPTRCSSIKRNLRAPFTVRVSRCGGSSIDDVMFGDEVDCNGSRLRAVFFRRTTFRNSLSIEDAVDDLT